MDESVLVEVYVPAAMHHYEMMIPLDVNAKIFLDKLQEMMEEESEGTYVAHEHSVLYLERRNGYIDLQRTLREMGIMQGDRLILL